MLVGIVDSVLHRIACARGIRRVQVGLGMQNRLDAPFQRRSHWRLAAKLRSNLMKSAPAFSAALCFTLCLTFAQPASAEPLDVAGVWQTSAGKEIVIGPCEDGDSATLCGVATKTNVTTLGTIASEPIMVAAPVILDSGKSKFLDNPIRFLRAMSPAALGKVILQGFRSLDGKTWMGGVIIHPMSGRRYQATLALEGPNALKVVGCLGPFCGEQIWTRKA